MFIIFNSRVIIIIIIIVVIIIIIIIMLRQPFVNYLEGGSARRNAPTYT
jgi:preprotein translocase subunit SecG